MGHIGIHSDNEKDNANYNLGIIFIHPRSSRHIASRV